MLSSKPRRLTRKKDKHYKRWSRSGRPADQNKVLKLKHLIGRLLDRAYEKYLQDILGLSNEADDHAGEAWSTI